MTEPTPPSDPDAPGSAAADEEYEDDEPRNPFDNPWFLPLLVGGFALWCGWDGFVSNKYLNDPSTLWFNRIGFVVLGAWAAWLVVRARREGQGASQDQA